MLGLLGILLVALLLHVLYQYLQSNLVWVKANDGRTYRVQNLPDKQAAANTIGTLLTTAEGFFKTLPATHEYENLRQRFKPDHVEENSSSSRFTSFSENKGERIVLCLRQKDESQTLTDPNTLMFVFLHECAHLMTDETGHTDDFWDNFKQLLQAAVQAGIYSPVNYAQEPITYCGMVIDSSPLIKDDPIDLA